MRTRVLASITTVALSGAIFFGVAAPAASAAPPTAAPTATAAAQAKKQLATFTAHYNVPMKDATTGQTVKTLDATFTATRFLNDNGVLKVTGDLVGTATNSAGVSEPVNVQNLTMTVGSAGSNTVTALAAPACDVLNLVLGPLHLDLLGLVVDLNQVVLNITAQPGAGNLLGNLLCAITGLLDGQNGLNGLVALLNRILGI
ncbi:ABC transporter substrate-binding protein [Paenarthrobacter nicotinovorans]|uniref:ABC transporter substrate-binding protein n=1 Tax=Paenarthrobacter nicotinovorans TaxID=29320 RepID=UPI0011A81126|nr:ABC transporter substrate-binding protein [Paenarthrobacter nicotinovorans]